ncbi:PIF1-like helicase-domain-containing protein [Mycena floridula]|nr:PIF1-like helicase-domain-containing protein [Mycena floridula]
MSASKRKQSSAPADQPNAKKTLIQHYFRPLVAVSATKDDPATSVILNEEQTKVLRLVVDDGESLFFSGPAGTGKSLLLRAIIQGLVRKFRNTPEAVSVTASTGMAASNIGGTTIHSWGAISPGLENFDSLVKCIRGCKPALLRWKNTQVLIIDEGESRPGSILFPSL